MPEITDNAAYPVLSTLTSDDILVGVDVGTGQMVKFSVAALIAALGGGGGGGSTDPEVVRDTIAAALVAGSARVTVTPNDTADTITVDVPAASTTVVGAVELATTTEATTGTDTTRAVTAAGVAAVADLKAGKKYTWSADKTAAWSVAVGDLGSDMLVADNVGTAHNITLPVVGSDGDAVTVVVVGAGLPTFVLGSGASWLVTPTPSAAASAQGSVVTAIRKGTDQWVLTGDLA